MVTRNALPSCQTSTELNERSSRKYMKREGGVEGRLEGGAEGGGKGGAEGGVEGGAEGGGKGALWQPAR